MFQGKKRVEIVKAGNGFVVKVHEWGKPADFQIPSEDLFVFKEMKDEELRSWLHTFFFSNVSQEP